MRVKILDLGCGKHKTPSSIGIDIDKNSDADVICDLNETFPFKENEFETIICQDVLEHLIDIDKTLKEIHRIAKHRAVVKIRTPHYTSSYAYNDPTHRHYWGIAVLDRFIEDKPDNGDDRVKFALAKREIMFPKLWRILGVKFLANKFPHRYEQLFAFMFPAENLYFELKVIKK